jgi:SAM-dependent methyltransferase
MCATENYVGRDNLKAMRAAPRYNNAILRHILDNVFGARVLDFGAGDGLFAELMARHSLAPVCVEPDLAMSALLQAKGFEAHASLDSLIDRFDTIYSINVLEHIDNDAETLFRLASLALPLGRLVVFVPAWPILYSSMDRRVGHVRRYRKKDLLAKLDRAGWAVQHIRYFDSLGFFSAFAYRFIGSSTGELSDGTLAFYDKRIFPVSKLLDRLFSRFVGKNLLVIAQRRGDYL